MRARHLLAAAMGLVAALGMMLPAGGPTEPAAASTPATAAAADPRANIVLVVVDDFSMDLLPTMHHAMEMRRTGASYRHSYVVDSRCCPSRASLLTGQYPHQTGVRSNYAAPSPDGPLGGFAAFQANGNLERSVNVQLQASGYTTGFVGKFLNEYAGEVLPPGWSWWRAVTGGAYDGWGFRTTFVRDGALKFREHPAPPASASEGRKDRAYAGQVMKQMAVRFIRSHRDDPEPYFLEVAPYAAHSRVNSGGAYPGDPLFPPSFRDRRGDRCGERSCSRLDARDLPGFADPQFDNVPRFANGDPAPQWRRNLNPPTVRLTSDLRNRARMAQSIDRLLARILEVVDRNTYVVFTSDNGLHLGQHRLGRGKGTPFSSDVQVPLLVVGPGVRPGARGEVVSNIDLAPTFEDLAGLTPPSYRSGRSLVPTFGKPNLKRRATTFFEHVDLPKESPTDDPDVPFDSAITRVPSYLAVRTRGALLVRFDLDPGWDQVEHAWEFYDYSRVDWERTNLYGRARYARRIANLTRKLEQFDACSTYVGSDPVPEECRNLTQ